MVGVWTEGAGTDGCGESNVRVVAGNVDATSPKADPSRGEIRKVLRGVVTVVVAAAGVISGAGEAGGIAAAAGAPRSVKNSVLSPPIY